MSLLKSRRNFLETVGFSGTALAASGWMGAARAAEGRDADLIVINAKVYTVDDAMPRAEAFAVRDSKFIAVGSTTDIKSLAGPRTQTIDAKGAAIIPGCIDTHNHAPGNTLMYDVLVGNPYEVEFVTIQSIVDKLKAKAAKLPADTWVEGYFFDDTKVKDNREVNVHDLDKVSTTQPVCVHHRGGHTSYYNSYALKLAGITKNTPNMESGTYDKDARGELIGRVTDRARGVFMKVGKHESFTPAQQLERDRNGLAFISKKFVQYGVTSVCHQGGDIFALQQVRAAGELKHRVSFETNGDLLEAQIKTGIQTGYGDEWIRFGATSEHTVDGSFSERTMAISRPYIGISPPYQGNLTETPKDLDEWCERVHRAGIQVNCHANGDVAIDRTLTSYEKAMRAFPRADTRPKITHCSIVNPSLLQRIKALNVVPAEFSTYAYYSADKFHFYGEDFMKWAMPYRSMIDLGIKPSTGSDFSPGPFAPMMAIQGMVTRKGFNGETWGVNQKITIDEAIRCSTLYGAYNTHEEKIKGSITPGKLADFVVLSDDPHAVDISKIVNIKAVRTVVGGTTVYQA
jgi:predicted amidohydrolase YtcJ